MQEVVTVHVGGFGNRAGYHFWNSLLTEHGLVPNGTSEPPSDTQVAKLQTFFHEESRGPAGYVPRAVMLDMEKGDVDWLRASKIGSCFRPDNIVAGEGSGANCWAFGFYGEENKMDEAMDSIRAEIERCDRIQAIQFVHSLGGGAGSGLATGLINRLKEEYPDILLSSFSLFPSPIISGSIVEPYNAVLALHYLIESCDSCVCMDDGMFARGSHYLKEKNEKFDFTQLFASCMVEFTASMRFPGQICTNYRSLLTNMVPFPRLHFFIHGLALPLHSPSYSSYSFFSLSSLIEQLFHHKNLMATCSPQFSQYYTLTSMFRGNTLSACDIESRIASLCDENSTHFVPWLPGNTKCTLSLMPPSSSSSSSSSSSFSSSSSCTSTSTSTSLSSPSSNSPSPLSSSSSSSSSSQSGHMSAVYLANTTAITDVFNHSLTRFNNMYKRRAFLNPYLNRMDQMEFEEAQSNLEDLISEYRMNTLL